MGLFDISGRFGGNPALNASQPALPPMSGNQMPWGSGFEGMTAMSEEERKKALMMKMLQQQYMAQRMVQMPLASGPRR